MEMRQVEAFLAVADELHFGQAAERLLWPRPRVSKLIAALEREVGGALFERTSRRVRLTPLGTLFREQLRRGYAQMQAAVADARAAATQASGVVRVGFTVTTGGQALTRLVSAFESAHPDCEIVLREVGIGDPYQPLRRDEIDVLVNWLSVDEPDLTAGPVIDRCERALAVATGHPLASSRQVSAEDLADLEMARAASLPGALYDALLPPRTPSGRPTRRTQQVHGLHHTLALVASGQIVHPTVASLPLAHRADITLIPITGLPPLPLGLIWCTAHENARIRALADTAATLPSQSTRAWPSDSRAS
jgi:DNA-binding transcriptional LysR family regulator